MNNKTTSLSILSSALCLLPLAASAADIEKGKALFQQRCVMCHGEQGAGDGVLAASLPAESKPRNIQEWKMKFATDDAKLKELLKKGGGGVGLNALMPAQADLSDSDLDNVIEFIKTLKKS